MVFIKVHFGNRIICSLHGRVKDWRGVILKWPLPAAKRSFTHGKAYGFRMTRTAERTAAGQRPPFGVSGPKIERCLEKRRFTENTSDDGKAFHSSALMGGGVAWVAYQHGRNHNIGSSVRLNKTYLGIAFCFSSNRDFKGFESFISDNMLPAGSFQRAIRKFRETNSDIGRVVLHYYKKINREDAAVLKAALGEMKLDIPMVILTIHKSG